MFLKEKFTASGEYDNLKARLVAGGDQQDKELYTRPSHCNRLPMPTQNTQPYPQNTDS
jgi:hypothetical protein